MTFHADRWDGWTPSPRLLEVLRGVRTLVWDFDGVIADTEPSQGRAFSRVLQGMGVTPKHEFFRDLVGRNEREIWSELAAEYHISADIEELRILRSKEYLRIARDCLAPAYYVRPMMRWTLEHSGENIIVSSGSYRNVKALLDHWDLSGKLSCVYCEGAPASVDLHTKAARIEHVATWHPGPMVLVEDTPRYLAQAAQLGFRTIAVQHSLNDLADAAVDYRLPIELPEEGRSK